MVETVLDIKKKTLFVKWVIFRLHYIILNFLLVLLLVLQVVTGEAHIAHYVEASLLVECRLTYPKARKVATGQTFVKSQSRMLTSSPFWPEQLLWATYIKCFILLVTGSPQEFLSHILPGN